MAVHPPPLPAWWLKQAACIATHESTLRWHIRNPPYYGGYQFLLSTWRSVGGRGLPSDATAQVQTVMAWRVWRRDGGSWREWSTARVCGLR